MRILIFNWKDVRHPQAGGAEYVTHEFAKELVRRNHEVIIFTSKSPVLKNIETIDGVTMIRYGNLYTVHLHACLYYFRHLKNWPDVVIDQFHGIPFFTPLYIKKCKLAYIHEVAGEIWHTNFKFPLNQIGYIFEKFQFQIYKNIYFLTHSSSTKKELITYNVAAEKITVISPTVAMLKSKTLSKNKNPTLIYLGRLAPIKRIELLLTATSQLEKIIAHLSVWIVGSGNKDYIQKLIDQVNSSRLGKTIKFFNSVSEIKKYELLQKAWINIHPSIKEGYGLTVVEAARMGTPTIAFYVGGLRDIIQHRKTGVLVKPESSVAMSAAIKELIEHPNQRIRMGQRAYRWSQSQPSWTVQTRKLETLLRSLA